MSNYTKTLVSKAKKDLNKLVKNNRFYTPVTCLQYIYVNYPSLRDNSDISLHIKNIYH